MGPNNWEEEIKGFQSLAKYEPESLYPQSSAVSQALNDLLQLIMRDFVSSWYRNISKNPRFANEVESGIRSVLMQLRDRLLKEDLVELLVSRVVPILTTHLKDFDQAERAVRGKNLTGSVTEFGELDIAIAARYKDGHLHPAASISFTDPKQPQQDHLRRVAVTLLPQLLPRNFINSRAVSVLIREIITCAVLLPALSLLTDPDTWNQLMEGYGRATLQDRKTVRRLRAALDQHASPAPKSKHNQSFARLGPNDTEREFERFVRAIRRCNNLSDARLFRNHVSSQLKRESMIQGQDQLYIRRLETGKRVLDQKVAKLSALSGHQNVGVANSDLRYSYMTKPHEVPLVDVMHNAAGLSYFMEFMDRLSLMSLVQFWIVVDGLRNPLEDDFGDDASNNVTWSSADRNDIVLISENHLSKPELHVPEQSIKTVKDFIHAGKRATSDQYQKARTVILTTQSAILEELQNKYYPKFKNSDLYYKYLASDEAAASAAPRSERPSLERSSVSNSQERRPLPPLMQRTDSQSSHRSRDLRRAALSSSDMQSAAHSSASDFNRPRRSADSDRAPLFDDDIDTDPLALSVHGVDKSSQNGDRESEANHVIETMEAALNDIITDEPNGRFEDLRGQHSHEDTGSPRSSIDIQRNGSQQFMEKGKQKNISSLGLVNTSSRIGVFKDDDLFPDEEKFIEDEYADPEDGEDDKDPAEEIHEAAPGDLGLAEAIAALTSDIEKLLAQEEIVDTLTRKAELTNNTAELRILGKSKSSLRREIRRKEMQRQQYMIQESDNSLYGRSTVQIKSIMVGKEEDGREYALCMY